MVLLEGKKTANQIKEEIKTSVEALVKKGNRPPHLAAVLVGNDGASLTYVGSKVKSCQYVGFESTLLHLNEHTTEEELLQYIKTFNEDSKIDGYIVQLPLPLHIDANVILDAINPQKDADGLHPLNLGRLVTGQKAPRPCTPQAIVELLLRNEISLSGKDVTIIGRGLTVGRPLSILLSHRDINATVTVVHTGTRDLQSHTKKADVVIAALGKAHFLHGAMVKPGVVAVDVGITRTARGLQGDFHPNIAGVASAYSPMPGGVGPMTRAMLLQNLVELAER